MIKNLPANAGDGGDVGSIPGLGRSLEEEMATHSSILAWRIPKERGAWWATIHGVSKSQTQLSTHTHSCFTMLYNKVNELYVHMYPCPPGPPSHRSLTPLIQVTTEDRAELPRYIAASH